MAIYKTKAGYRVQVDIGKLPDGRRDRKSVVVKTMREAKKAELDLLMLKRDLRGHSNRVTFRDLVETYYLPDRVPVLRKNTMQGYLRDINLRLMPAFGSKFVADIRHSDIQRMISSCSTRKVATNARETLRAIMTYAQGEHLISDNPAMGSFRFPEKIVEAEEDRRRREEAEWITSFDEQRALIESIDDPALRRLLVLGLCFGLRKGEILGLEWADVDLARREITVRRTVTFTAVRIDVTPPKTKNARRSIPMSDFAHEMLTSFREEGGITRITGPVVCHRGTYMSPKVFERKIRLMRASGGVPYVTPSNMRHSFATACIREGMEVATLSKILGHAQISTTYNRYVKPTMANLHKDMQLVSAAYRKAV
jgi:integrase